jgi:hypothetical protein
MVRGSLGKGREGGVREGDRVVKVDKGSVQPSHHGGRLKVRPSEGATKKRNLQDTQKVEVIVVFNPRGLE